MATVEKNFRIKQGLTVEGASGTINGSNILTEASTEFLQDTVGAMVSSNTESGISVTYDDDGGKLNFSVSDVALGTGTTGDYVASVSAGSGISVTGTGEGATVTVTNDDKGSSQNIFKTISANGTSIVADSNTDTLTITPSTGIAITGDAGSDTVTITNSGVTAVAGTDNEITVSAGTGSVTIGLPDDVTIGNNLTVTGNLTVNGTTTTINTDTLAVEDNIVLLNKNVTGTPTTDSGIEVERGDYTNAKIYWNETENAWYISTPGDSSDAATDAVISTGGSVNVFNNFSDGSTSASPDNSNDTLTITGSGAITVNVNATSDTVTIGTNAAAAIAVGSVTLEDAVISSKTETSAGTSHDLDVIDTSLYSSAKYLIQAKNGSGDIEVTELLVAVDGSYNVYITEYANMFSNASLAEYTVTASGGAATLSATSTSSGVVFKMTKTYIEA